MEYIASDPIFLISSSYFGRKTKYEKYLSNFKRNAVISLALKVGQTVNLTN